MSHVYGLINLYPAAHRSGFLHERMSLRRPTYGCGFVGEDGCCEHDDNPTPECHSGIRCPVVEKRSKRDEEGDA